MTDRDFSLNMDDEPKNDSRSNSTLALGIVLTSMLAAVALYEGNDSHVHRRHFSSGTPQEQADESYNPRYPRATEDTQPQVTRVVQSEADVLSDVPIQAPQSQIDAAVAEQTDVAGVEDPAEVTLEQMSDQSIEYFNQSQAAVFESPTEIPAPTSVPTSAPLPTLVPLRYQRPSATPSPASLEAALEEKTTAQLLAELKNETGLALVLPKDVYTSDQLETYGSYIEMQSSPADDQLKRHVAEAILGLPDEHKKVFSKGYHTVVLQRVRFPEDAHFEKGQVITGFYDTDEDGIQLIKLDAPSGHTYDQEVIEAPLPSGLQPYEEVQFALYEYIFMEHFLTDEGKAQISWFVSDNASYNELDYSTVQMLNSVLGFADGSMTFSLEEIAARMLAWNRVGRKDIIEKVKSITGMNLANLPIY